MSEEIKKVILTITFSIIFLICWSFYPAYSQKMICGPSAEMIESVEKKFDACLSISSFEHDGLGRYGDPLNPNGDLEAMQKMKGVLKPAGVMFLSVPIGIDTVWFNVHRVYGEHRFYELIKGWEALNRYGFNALSFNSTINNGSSTTYQPVIVLENQKVS